MTRPVFDHVILTRFNLPSAGRESLIRAQDGWLRNRVALFEKYCLPSIRRQDTNAFKWIIYFDPESPQWLMDWLKTLDEPADFVPVFRESVSHTDLLADLRTVTGAQSQTLITTNLDNDDAVATDFVSRIQAAVQGHARQAIYLANGLILNEPNLYIRRDQDNAFCSVAESWNEPMTAWTDWHNRLHLHMQVNLVEGPPAWLQVIHGTNVSNRVHGRLTRPGDHLGSFGSLGVALPEPGRGKYFTEAYVTRPLRSSLWAVRSLAKRLVLQVAGRDGLDSLRNTVATTASRLPLPFVSRQPRQHVADPESSDLNASG